MINSGSAGNSSPMIPSNALSTLNSARVGLTPLVLIMWDAVMAIEVVGHWRLANAEHPIANERNEFRGALICYSLSHF